jgi:uncharacterized protein (DUF2141 family)
MKKLILLLFLTSVVFSQTGKVKVQVTGIEEIVGNISIGLFNNPVGFPKRNNDAIGIDLKVTSDSLEYEFIGLTYGEYAIAIYHDENENGELDRNFLGIPSENYMFSNYATGNFGPPSFEDAKFILIDSIYIKLDFNK